MLSRFLFFLFEKGSHVVQADLKLFVATDNLNLLISIIPLPTKRKDYRHGPLGQASRLSLNSPDLFRRPWRS